MAASVEFLLRALCAQWLIAATAISSYAIAAVLLRGVPATLRWLGVGIAGIWLATVAFHLLAAVHWFTLPVSLAGITVLTIALVSMSPELTATLRRDRRALHRVSLLFRHSRYRGIATGLLVCAAPVLLRPLFMPATGWDTLVYHGLKAGLWVKNAGELHMEAPGPWAVYGERWGGAEVLMAWAMLPFHSDLLALAAESLQWLGFGLAVTVFARQLGAREPYASTAAAFLMAVPTVRLMVGSGYVEPVLYLCLSAALAFALQAWRRPSLGSLVFAAAAAALVIGIKISSAQMMAGVLLFPIVRTITDSQRRAQRLGWIGVAAVVGAAAVLPWPLHTYMKTGLPLSPLPITIAGHTLGVSDPETEWYMTRPNLDPGDWERERAVLAQVFEWPGSTKTTLQAISILPAVVGLLGLFFLRRGLGVNLFAIAALVLALGSYYDPRLTVLRRYWSDSSSRFLFPAFIVLVPVSLAWCHRLPALGGLYARLLWVGAVCFVLETVAAGVSATGARATLVVAAVLWAAWYLLTALQPRLQRAAYAGVTIAVVCGCLLGLDELRSETRAALMRQDFAPHDFPRYWVNAAMGLDDATQMRRIAVTGGPYQNADNWFAASLLGAQLQNDVIYVSPMADGSIPHFGLGALNEKIVSDSDTDAWLARLREQHVTHVFSFGPPGVELGWMRGRHGDFHEIAGEAYWGVFEVLATEPRAEQNTAHGDTETGGQK